MLCKTALQAAFCLFLLAGSAAASGKPDPEMAIRKALDGWTVAFNDRDATAVCDLFARDLHYNARGMPEQDYTDMCDRLRRTLAGKEVGYSYHFDIKEIIASGDLAVVRLVLYLSVSRPGVPAVTKPEQAMDVFQRQADGGWKIIRFISYDEQT